MWCVVYRPKNCGRRSKTESNKLKVLIQESVVGVCKSIQHDGVRMRISSHCTKSSSSKLAVLRHSKLVA